MMTTRHVWLESMAVAACLIAAAGGMATYLNSALAREHRLTAKRLEHAFRPLIDQAHRQKDDVALQGLVSALAQAPGISLACVVDTDEKIIAHSRAAQIGKTFRTPHGERALFAFPLRDGAAAWGTLLFSLSSQTTDHVVEIAMLGLLCGAGLLTAFYALRGGAFAWTLAKQRRDLRDVEVLLAEEQSQRAQLQRQADTDQNNARASLAAAMNKLPYGTVLLDARQRVLAVNAAALESWGLTEASLGAGCSWQDVPDLRDQGATLEQSLAAPGRVCGDVVTELQDGVVLTWFTPRPALRAYR